MIVTQEMSPRAVRCSCPLQDCNISMASIWRIWCLICRVVFKPCTWMPLGVLDLGASMKNDERRMHDWSRMDDGWRMTEDRWGYRIRMGMMMRMDQDGWCMKCRCIDVWMCHVGSPGKAAGVPRWVSQSSSPCRRCDTSRALRCRASSFAAWLRRYAVPKAWRCSQGKGRSTPVMAQRSRGQWFFCDMLAYLNISLQRKKWPRCFFLPFSSGFSRTLRTLQLWLVSLPGQGLGWRWDLVVGPWWIGELAVRSQYWPPRLGFGTVAMLRGQVFFWRLRWPGVPHSSTSLGVLFIFMTFLHLSVGKKTQWTVRSSLLFGSCRILWSVWTTATWWRSRRWSCLSAEHQWPSPREPSGGSLEGLGPEVARCTAPETTKRSEVGELVEHRGAKKHTKNIQKTSSIHISIFNQKVFLHCTSHRHLRIS